MSHSITSRRGTTRRRRRASRIGSPPVRRLAAQRPPHVDAPAPAPSLVAARAAQRRGQLEARHQPVELRELVRLEARRSACPRAAPRRSPSRSARRSPRRSSSPAPGGEADKPRGRSRAPRRRAKSCDRRGCVVRRLPTTVCRSSGSKPLAVVARAEDREEDRVEGLRPARDRTRARRGRPVQPPAADRPYERERGANSAERAGVTGTPASCRRRLRAPASAGRSSWIVSTPKRAGDARQSPLRTSSSRPAARTAS